MLHQHRFEPRTMIVGLPTLKSENHNLNEKQLLVEVYILTKYGARNVCVIYVTFRAVQKPDGAIRVEKLFKMAVISGQIVFTNLFLKPCLCRWWP